MLDGGIGVSVGGRSWSRGRNDVLDGGAGVDTADYSAATSSLDVDLALTKVVATGADGSDVLIGIENVVGGKGADWIRGSTGPNVLRGGAGKDVLLGRGGNDSLFGDDGDDTSTVERATTPSRETEAPIACSEETASML